MPKTEKRRRRRRRHRKEKARAVATGGFTLPSPGRFKVLAGLLVLSALASVGLSRCNRTEITTPESAESIRIKQEMINQFVNKEEGLQNGGEAAAEPGSAE